MDLTPFELEDSLISDIKKFGKIEVYKKGSHLIDSQTLLNFFFFVIDGRVRSYSMNFNNLKEQTFFIYKKGDMFDIVSLLENKEHEIMYEIIEKSTLLKMPINIVREWIKKDSRFRDKLFPYIAEHIKYLEELSSDLSLLDTFERLIKLLVDSLNPKKIFKYNITKGLTNTQIASLIGSVRQVVERHLKVLKEKEIIDKKKTVQIEKVDNLLKLLP